MYKKHKTAKYVLRVNIQTVMNKVNVKLAIRVNFLPVLVRPNAALRQPRVLLVSILRQLPIKQQTPPAHLALPHNTSRAQMPIPAAPITPATLPPLHRMAL